MLENYNIDGVAQIPQEIKHANVGIAGIILIVEYLCIVRFCFPEPSMCFLHSIAHIHAPSSIYTLEKVTKIVMFALIIASDLCCYVSEICFN